jgi:hypothetical protein
VGLQIVMLMVNNTIEHWLHQIIPDEVRKRSRQEAPFLLDVALVVLQMLSQQLYEVLVGATSNIYQHLLK